MQPLEAFHATSPCLSLSVGAILFFSRGAVVKGEESDAGGLGGFVAPRVEEERR